MLMYMREATFPEGTELSSKSPGFALSGLIVTSLAVLYLGVFPDDIIELASSSIQALL